jgi:hypothetical protein
MGTNLHSASFQTIIDEIRRNVFEQILLCR